MDTLNPYPDDLNEANERLRRMLAGATSPDDLARLSDEQLEALLESASDATLADEQVDLILRKVSAKLVAAERASEPTLPPPSSVPPAATTPPTSPVLGFLGDITHLGGSFTPTFWILFGVAIALTFGAAVAIRGISWHNAGANGGQVAVGDKTEPPKPSSSAPIAATESLSAIVATITKMVDCRCAADCPAPRLRDCVEVGRQFDLEAGLLEITYDTGAKVILHGPVSYKVRSNNSGFLAYGDLTGVVEKPAGQDNVAAEEHDLFGCRPPVPDPPQFTVRTPEADVTDLGTEFGVRVGRAGRTESHVFRGQVKVGIATSGGTAAGAANAHEIVLNANESIRVDKHPDGDPLVIVREGAKSPAEFVREGQLEAAEPQPPKPHQTSDSFARWQAFSKSVRGRSDLLAYYDFQPDEYDRGVLSNRAATGKLLSGRLYGKAAWTTGRYPGKQAVKFGAPNSGVRIDLPSECQAITLVASVQIDRLGPLNAIIHSDGWNSPGQFAWQINHNGLVSIGIHNDVFDRQHRAREQDMVWPKAGIARERLAQWCQLAVVYDSALSRARFYLDGVELANLPITTHQGVRLGSAVIGSHLADKTDANPGDRTLAGRMDELMIFKAALSAQEITALCRQETAPEH
jgi:hypothetical protein